MSLRNTKKQYNYAQAIKANKFSINCEFKSIRFASSRNILIDEIYKSAIIYKTSLLKYRKSLINPNLIFFVLIQLLILQIQFYSSLIIEITHTQMKLTVPKQEDTSPISDFNSHYQFLNNDHPAWVLVDGISFPSASIAYQACRTDNISIRQSLSSVETYDKFKQIALSITNPSDWNQRRQTVMEKIVRDKFKRNKELSSKLAATNPRTLVNGYKQGGQNEQYWGVVNGKGFNFLGKILMNIREEIINGVDSQKWINDQGVQSDQKMRAEVSIVVLREDKPIDKYFLQKKAKLFFGALPSNDYKLQHPSISKQHACIYFGIDLNLMLVDLGSSHGTSITRQGKVFKLQALKPVALEKADLIIFGLSSRKYRVEMDISKVQNYMKEKQQQLQQEFKQINAKSKSKRKSRSRSRSYQRKKKQRS